MDAPGSLDPTDAALKLRRQFWLLVGALNVAMMATALGVFVLVFWSRPTLGVGLIAVGFGAAVFGVLRYRRVRDELPYSE